MIIRFSQTSSSYIRCFQTHSTVQPLRHFLGSFSISFFPHHTITFASYTESNDNMAYQQKTRLPDLEMRRPFSKHYAIKSVDDLKYYRQSVKKPFEKAQDDTDFFHSFDSITSTEISRDAILLELPLKRPSRCRRGRLQSRWGLPLRSSAVWLRCARSERLQYRSADSW